MTCPHCQSEHARLSWLREHSVVYWCRDCHQGFEVSRHRSHVAHSVAPDHDGDLNGTASVARAS